jgi:hypothetical protein
VSYSLQKILSCGSVIGIGSLPFTSFVDAFTWMDAQIQARKLEAPFMPQLPRLSGSMIDEVLHQFSGRYLQRKEDGSYFILEARASEWQRLLQTESFERPGFVEFCEWLDAEPEILQQVKALKTQAVGPLTLLRSLRFSERAEPFSQDIQRALCGYLERGVVREIQILQSFEKPVLAFYDEPGWASLRNIAGSQDTLANGLSALQAGGAFSGLHCCGAVPADALADLADRKCLDIFSFDASLLKPTGELLAAFLNLPALVFGLLPSSKNPNLELKIYLANWQNWLNAAGVGRASLRGRSWLSTSCGLGLVSSEQAELVFASQSELSQQMQRHYELLRDSQIKI